MRPAHEVRGCSTQRRTRAAAYPPDTHHSTVGDAHDAPCCAVWRAVFCGARPRARPGQDIVVLRCAAVWRGLKKLLMLELRSTQITDAGCATLAAALNRGTLPALEEVMCCVLR